MTPLARLASMRPPAPGPLAALPLSAAGLLAVLALSGSASAQDVGAAGWGGMAIPLVTHASPALSGDASTEAYLTQPNLFVRVGEARVRFVGTVNLEGLTLRRGELNHGIWGEGYADRRHPHTVLHEAMMILEGPSPFGVMTSLAAGRGFVPFGTDDPMVRPFVKYPANHHLAQLLERWTVIGAARRGPVLVEAALFHGDEPTGPTSLGRVARFGDSYAGRLTILPLEGLEVSASGAEVASPEHPRGGGMDHRKRSLALRYAGSAGPLGGVHGLFEWARTEERLDGHTYFRFRTLLGEAGVTGERVGVAVRYEDTVRPEEERLENAFRTPQPPPDLNLLGATRWRIASVAVSAGASRLGLLGAAPFFEVSRAAPEAALQPALLDPAAFFGRTPIWTYSLGVRLTAGSVHERMGRYGAARPSTHHRSPVPDGAPLHTH